MIPIIKIMLAGILILISLCCCPLLPDGVKETDPDQVIHIKVGKKSKITTTSWEGVWLVEHEDKVDNVQVQVSAPDVVSVVKVEAKNASGIGFGGLDSFHVYVTLQGQSSGVAQVAIGIKPEMWGRDPASFADGPRNPTHYYTVVVGQPDDAPDTPLPTPTNTQTDLNGDGVAEALLLTAGSVEIRSRGELVWRNPLSWQVIQAQLTDLNHDGQREVTLLVWRPFQPWPVDRYLPHGGRIKEFHDANGRSCYLILIGWQRGKYRELWAGSAMSSPLRSFSAIDVDGDGRQELVGFESDYTDPRDVPARAITYWEWNGFGFTLLIRLKGENYENAFQ
jgi:hypothetical protein